MPSPQKMWPLSLEWREVSGASQHGAMPVNITTTGCKNHVYIMKAVQLDRRGRRQMSLRVCKATYHGQGQSRDN